MKRNLIVRIVTNYVVSVKVLINLYKRITVNPLGLIYRNEFEYLDNGMAVLYAPEIAARKGIGFAGALFVKFPDEKIPIIIIDDHFKLLSKKSQEFFLMHEMGHINAKHLEELETKNVGKLHNFLRWFGKNWNYEFEADNYAAGICGKEAAIAALVEVWNLETIGNALLNAREIKARINMIKNM